MTKQHTWLFVSLLFFNIGICIAQKADSSRMKHISTIDASPVELPILEEFPATDIQFKASTTDIESLSTPELAILVSYLEAHSTEQIEIVNHLFSKNKNSTRSRKFSIQRARAIAIWLEKKGIEKGRIHCKGVVFTRTTESNPVESMKDNYVEIRVFSSQ